MIMNTLLILTAMALPTVQYGWEYDASGDLVYIVQVEPLAAEALKSGLELTSQVPTDLGAVRYITIRVGDGQLPQAEPPATAVSISPPQITQPRLDPPIESSPASPPGQLPAYTGAVRLSGHQTPSVVDEPSAAKDEALPVGAQSVEKIETPADNVAEPAVIGSGAWIMTVLTLFASLAGNVFLGWVAWDYYGRYRQQMSNVR
jgi:hypothetical protein